jgi:membrane protease YdiL (CAAX protease family)
MSLTLGQEEEYNKYKVYYILFLLLIFAFLAWSAIGVGADPVKRRMVNYYMWMGFVALAFILFDNLTFKKFDIIDTVTIEKTPIHPKFILFLGFVLSILMSWRIITSQTAFIPYPTFQFFDHKLPNAVLSGVAGIIEDLFFFSVLFPVIYALLNMQLQNKFISGVLSCFSISFIFMLFHLFVYGTNQPALLMTFLFALLSSSLVFLTRSIIISHFLHFSNNFVASLIVAKVMIIFF